MTREERMQDFIERAQKSATLFVTLLLDSCPEMLAKEDKLYMHSDIKNSIGLWFDNALEDAKEADRAGMTDYRENASRDLARGLS